MPSYDLADWKWGAPAFGTPGGPVTWSFATSNLPGQPVIYDAAIPAFMQGEVRRAFERWEGVANIDFIEVPDGPGAAIRFGLDAIDGLNGVVGNTFVAGFLGAPGQIVRATIALDLEGWRPVGDAQVASATGLDLYVVALHELGHAIGLDHTVASLEVMNPFASPQVRDLLAGDIAGAQAVYGAPVASAQVAAAPPAGLAPFFFRGALVTEQIVTAEEGSAMPADPQLGWEERLGMACAPTTEEGLSLPPAATDMVWGV